MSEVRDDQPDYRAGPPERAPVDVPWNETQLDRNKRHLAEALAQLRAIKHPPLNDPPTKEEQDDDVRPSSTAAAEGDG